MGSLESERPVIAVIGSLNIDHVIFTPRMPKGGETLTANAFQVSLGGKGANQAVACAKLSRHQSTVDDGSVVVQMVGAVGDDAYGSTAIAALQSFGVDTLRTERRSNTKTGVAIILVEPSGENRILLSPEANHTLLPAQFAHDLPAPRPSLIILQLEIPLETVLQILSTATKQNIPVLLNPAPAQRLPTECYKAVSHLLLNESEALHLSESEESSLQSQQGLLEVSQKFRSYGAKNVAITLGGRGVFYSGSEGQRGLVPAEPARVVDTTAAGDTFVGAYALEVVRPGPFDIQSAVQAANRAAAKTVEKKGAQESIPWRNELDV